MSKFFSLQERIKLSKSPKGDPESSENEYKTFLKAKRVGRFDKIFGNNAQCRKKRILFQRY